MRRAICVLVLLVATAITAAGTPEKTIYSQTSNKELKRKAFQVVKGIRGVLYSYNKKDREVLADYDRESRQGSTVAAEKTLRERWLKETDDLHASTMRKYKEQYWADAILLADEILRRLPKEKRETKILPIYQHPTNILGVRAIADHLELIAKRLPE